MGSNKKNSDSDTTTNQQPNDVVINNGHNCIIQPPEDADGCGGGGGGVSDDDTEGGGNFLSLSYHHHHTNSNIYDNNHNSNNNVDDSDDDPSLITPHNNNTTNDDEGNFYSTTTNVLLSSLVNQALLVDSSSSTTTALHKENHHQQQHHDEELPYDSQTATTNTENNMSKRMLEKLFRCCCCCFHHLHKKYDENINKDAFGFALRMSLVLTISSLFVLISPDDPYKQGSWVYITCCVVSWFPKSMDAASVLKKTFQRIIGTILGAILAMAVGLITISIDNVKYQATFLGLAIAFLSFVLPFVVVSSPQIFGGYSYASLLVLMTFGIAVFPFYNKHPNERAWEIGCYRIANVIIGCVLSGVCAIVVMPKSTYGAISQSVQYQINLAGESSEAVMKSACEVFSGRRSSIPLKTIIQRQVNNNNNNNNTSNNKPRQSGSNNSNNNVAEVDVVHKKYAAAIKDFISTKSLFPLLDYDPFFQLCFSSTKTAIMTGRNDEDEDVDDDDDDPKEVFKYRAAFNNQRAFRIQSTVILLDSIIRNDTGHKFTMEQLRFFDRVGLLIGKLLKVPFDDVNCNIYALELCSMLQQIRKYSVDAMAVVNSNKVALAAKRKLEETLNGDIIGNHDGGGDEEGVLMSIDEISTGNIDGNSDDDDDDCYLFLEDFVQQLEHFDRGQPLFAQSASILFLELVEHLILRSLRLYMTNRNNHDDMEQLLTSLRNGANNNSNNNKKCRYGNNDKSRRRLEAYAAAAAVSDDGGD